MSGLGGARVTGLRPKAFNLHHLSIRDLIAGAACINPECGCKAPKFPEPEPVASFGDLNVYIDPTLPPDTVELRGAERVRVRLAPRRLFGFGGPW